jgi:alpha-N-acetylglucosaminidase
MCWRLSGINAMIVERGMDTVLYETFRDVGYSDRRHPRLDHPACASELATDGQSVLLQRPDQHRLDAQARGIGAKIMARLRELGITPVLPGFYGIVPADFQKKFPHAHVVPQGEWAGFTRPGWLDPRDPMFAKLAARSIASARTVRRQQHLRHGSVPGRRRFRRRAHSRSGARRAERPARGASRMRAG